MTARPGLVTDAQIERMLRGRAAAPDASLLAAVLAQVEAAPQDRQWLRRAFGWLPWSVPTGSRRLLAFALLALLLAALAGAIAIGFHPPRPLPAVVPHANGGIVIQGEGCALVAVEPSTGATRPVFDGVPSCYAKVSNYEMAWDPSGGRLAFTYSFFCGGCGSDEANAAFAARILGLWILDPATSTSTQLVQCYCSMGEVTWSPDGSLIAFTRDDQVWVLPSAGGSAKRVSDGQSLYGHPAWSPDSRQLAYVDANGGPAGVVMVNWDGTGRSVVSGSLGETVQDIGWSPAAREILVTTSTGDGGTIRIVPSDRPGATTVLTLQDGTRPFSASWSPDGSRIAYERISETTDPDLPVTLTHAEIWVMARDGTSRQLVFQASSPLGAMSEVRWSPDGRYLSFSVLPDTEMITEGTSVIYVAAADGTGARTVQTANWNRPGVPSIAWQPLPVQAGVSP